MFRRIVESTRRPFDATVILHIRSDSPKIMSLFCKIANINHFHVERALLNSNGKINMGGCNLFRG